MSKYLLAASAAAILVAFALSAAPADARTRTVHGVFTGAHGRTYTADSTVTRGRGFRDRSTTWTGPNGGQRVVNDERTWGGFDSSHEHNVTFADGSTRSVETNRDGNGDGTGTITRTVTRRNGDTRTETGSYDIHRGP